MLVVALIALRHPSRNATSPGSAPTTVTVPARTSPSTTQPVSPGSRSSGSTPSSASTGLTGALPLVVLNDTSTPNLATQAADRFKAAGWTVSSVDESYSNTIISTAAYYDPSVPNAQAVAEALQHQFPAIKRVVPKFAPLVGGPIVVILTSDYSPG